MVHKNTYCPLLPFCRCACRGRVLVEVSEDQEVVMEAFMDDESVCCVAQVFTKMQLPSIIVATACSLLIL